ncbi:hypothetical protein HK099_005921 [Clydaea vesicula]|uniref:Uncharacterized protein n=1 Tax=Clydaea vesicula TaxID=447962 RepID=A0AAD5U0W2_9FUNG|nr:hypothetical protein HK099_005921 [Clydaea vesicula]
MSYVDPFLLPVLFFTGFILISCCAAIARSNDDSVDVVTVQVVTYTATGGISSNSHPTMVPTASNLNHDQYYYPPPAKKQSVHYSNFSSEYNSPETAPHSPYTSTYNRNSTTNAATGSATIDFSIPTDAEAVSTNVNSQIPATSFGPSVWTIMFIIFGVFLLLVFIAAILICVYCGPAKKKNINNTVNAQNNDNFNSGAVHNYNIENPSPNFTNHNECLNVSYNVPTQSNIQNQVFSSQSGSEIYVLPSQQTAQSHLSAPSQMDLTNCSTPSQQKSQINSPNSTSQNIYTVHTGEDINKEIDSMPPPPYKSESYLEDSYIPINPPSNLDPKSKNFH